jgi:hypothetical protein
MTAIRWIAICAFAPHAVFADCLEEQSIRDLDASYERAFQDLDFSWFEKTLHPQFVWVHDHATVIQRSKSELFEDLRAFAETSGSAQVRNQRDVEVSIVAKTAVVYGFTDVQRDGEDLTYHFMRTYSLIDDECLLLSNHTMAIPRPGE